MASRFIRRLLYGGDSRLRDYERACVDAVVERLSEEARGLIGRQLGALEVIQRFSDDKLTVMHMASLDAADLFRDRRPEVRAARVKLGGPGHEVTATLVLDRGRISSLEFNRPPGRSRDLSLQVSDVEVLVDPMAAADPDASRRETKAQTVEVSGLRLEARDVVAAREPEERRKYLASVGTVTPADYAELLAVTDGFITGDWEFMGTRSRLLTLQDVYIVAAERLDSTRALCFQEGAETPRVIVLDEIDERIQAQYPSFVDALREVTAADGPADHPPPS